MKKQFVFFTLILTILIQSTNGFSRNITFCPNPSITVNVDSGTCSAVVNSILPVTDISGGSMVLTTTLGNGDTFPVGTTTVTYQEHDATGIATGNICTFDVIVEDNEAPIPDVATLTDVTAACEVNSLTPPTATDNCGGTVIITNDTTLPITTQGTTLVTWTYNDGNGNTSTQTQNIIIDDVTAPTPDAATLADITAACEVNSLTAPTATDNCGGTVTVTNDATLPITTQGTTVVTWTYDDGNGNTATQTQNIIIDDVTAPIPDVATLTDVTAACEVNSLTPPTATDNCGGTVIITNDATLPITTQGTTLVTWTYDDGNGNTSTQTQNIIIDDVTAPIPDTATLTDVTAACEVNNLTPPTATDNCGGTVIVTNDATLPITTQGTTIVTWTYDDGNGNTSTQTQNIIIDDVTPPIPDAATLADVIAACEVNSLTDPTATDNCGGTVTVTNDATLPITTQGTTLVTWTYDDGNGNTSTQTQNIIIDDVTAPIPDAATLADVIAACEVNSLTDPTATDNCGGTVTVINDATLPITTQGTTVVTWTYDDGNGNTATQTQNIIIDDVTAPIPDVATLADVTAACEINSLTSPTATDNCGGTVIVTNDATLPITTQGTTLVTWTYNDGNGNTSTQTQNIIIDDVTAPIPDTATLTDVTAACEVNSLTPPTAADNCGGTVIVTNDASLPITAQGTTIVTWTYDDGNGNTATQTQNIIIDDVTAPIPDAATLADITAACEVTTLTPPTATDNCGGTIIVTNDATLPITTQGTTVVTWTYDDGNGNTATQTQNIIIDDVTAPIPDAGTLTDVTAACEVTTLTPPTATDNCGGTVTVTNDATLPITTQGTTLVTWTYDDGNGNTSTQTQNIIIDDVTAPTPDAATLADVTAACEVTTLTPPTATDNCGGTVIITNNASLPITTQGTTLVTWTYDDGNGNTSTQTQNIIIDDVTTPTPDAATLADITAECEVTTLTPPTATDNCGGTVIVTNDATLPITTQGTTLVTWTYDDGNGNTATQTQNIIVDDVTAPIPDAATLAHVTAACEVNSLTPPTATDNCGGTVIITNDATLPITTQGTTLVTWTYDDGNGNTSTQTQNIIIDDISAPIPDAATLADITAACEVNSLTAPTATDNCGGTVIITNDASLPITAQGTTIVTWTYDDGNGNTSTQTQNIIIDDVTAPTFNSCPSNLSRNNDIGACGAIVNYTIPTATDSCGTTVVTQTDVTGLTSGSLFPIGTTTIEYTADDGNGNTTICTFTITVIDNESPTITCPADITVNADANCEATIVTLGTPTTNDNCGVATVTHDLTLPLPVGMHNITWTITDTAGLTATCIQTVTVQDATPPVITCPGDITVNVDSGSCTASGVNLGTPTLFDNCGAVYTNNAPTLFSIGETIVTWTATDGAGLTDTCTQIVTVEPVLVCQNITVQLDNTGNATILPEDLTSSITCTSFTLNASQTNFDCGDIGVNTVTLTATDNASNTYSCNATVTIIDLPSNADITISTPDTSVCSTSFETFTATTTNFGTATPIYYWYVDGVLAQATTSNTYTPSGLTFGSYTIQAAIGPCTTKVESNEITISIYDEAPDVPVITGPTGLVCPTTTVTLSVPIDPNVESYNWSLSTELQITTNNGNEIEVYIDNTVITETTYTIDLTVQNPCGTNTSSYEIAINDNSANINAGPDIYLCASDLNSNGSATITMNGDADWVPLLFWGWNDNGAGGNFSEDECLIWFFGCWQSDHSVTDTYTLPNGTQPGDVITITLETYGEETITECGAPVFDEMQIHILEETEAEITSSDTTICEGESTNIVFEGVPGQQIGFRARTLGNNNIPGFPFTTAIIGSDGTYTYTTPILTQSTVYHLRRVRIDPSLGLGNQCQTIYPFGNETVTITVNEPATASLSYSAGTYCENDSVISSTLTGTNNYSGGTYSSSPIGLSINSSSGAIDPSTSTPGDYIITYTTPITDGCGSITTTSNITIQESVTANAGSITIDPASCGSTSIALNASAFATGITGEWSVTSGPAGYTFSNINDPNTLFTGQSNASYTLQWVATNTNICGTLSDTVSFTLPDNCGIQIDFDGTNDHINFNDTYPLPGNFSIEAWIKPNAINGGIQTILSKRNANNFATGYDLRLVNNTISFHANGFNISTNGITSNRWYHVAVTYNGTIYTLYVDGIQRNSSAGPTPATNNFNMLLGAMSRLNNVPTNYYNGWMDEIRLWNTDLNVTQIRQMMNQEIENNGGQVRGVEVPLNITGLTWSNLTAYYQMNQSTHISGGNLIANVGTSGTIRNITTLQAETAPLPYVTAANGNWNTPATWLNNDVQLLPNSTGINWNIVRTQHNVHSGNRATTVLGLLVDANTFTIDNDQSLTVDHYLNIDGVLDLEGESQLLQPSGSIVDYSGLGNLHRDQQGTTNMFNYNYWSSPVSTNGNTFQINALHDGINPVNWTSGNNATGSTNPVTISNRWLYLYENHTAGNYADWHAINQNYSVPVGLGFTMKGSGVGDPVSDIQNYTFVGQPNNGTITTPVTGGNEALIGNPYPSAINANQFILDNAGSITGPLYFWEHSLTNSSHITIDYEGGYATYSLAGGVAATTPPAGLTGIGVVGKVPRQYIAVGQGFYVTGDADGGTITFNNNQRTFVKETLGASVFLRTENNQEPTDIIKRVRLNFTSPEGAVRPLLLAFTPNNEASDAIDYGFDAKNSDYFPSDMSFLIENEKYIIQGVGAFDIEKMYPITIDLGVSGNIQIALDDLENFEEAIDVFIYDALLGSYTAINENNYQITLDAGSHNNRYFIAFKEDNELNTIDQQHNNVVINYLSATSEIYINVPNTVDIKQVYLVNLLGQTVKSWNATNAPLSQECKLPVRKIAEGTYIIKVRTSNNAIINKKVVVKQ
ncbi:HYR domain-containing protein [Lacinutrix gracilariae]|uniref:HYR domain-containing protein n=1 Tax=Lacinutrix gracilariae TaxID=1747198 RepID=A0ABW5JWI0_9FLAO